MSSFWTPEGATQTKSLQDERLARDPRSGHARGRWDDRAGLLVADGTTSAGARYPTQSPELGTQGRDQVCWVVLVMAVGRHQVGVIAVLGDFQAAPFLIGNLRSRLDCVLGSLAHFDTLLLHRGIRRKEVFARGGSRDWDLRLNSKSKPAPPVRPKARSSLGRHFVQSAMGSL